MSGEENSNRGEMKEGRVSDISCEKRAACSVLRPYILTEMTHTARAHGAYTKQYMYPPLFFSGKRVKGNLRNYALVSSSPAIYLNLELHIKVYQ